MNDIVDCVITKHATKKKGDIIPHFNQVYKNIPLKSTNETQISVLEGRMQNTNIIHDRIPYKGIK